MVHETEFPPGRNVLIRAAQREHGLCLKAEADSEQAAAVDSENYAPCR